MKTFQFKVSNRNFPMETFQLKLWTKARPVGFQLASNLEASLSSGVDRLLSENRPDQMNGFEWLLKEFSSNYQNQNSRLCKELLQAYVSYVGATAKIWMHLIASNLPGTWRICLISVWTNTTIHRHLFVQLPGKLNRWTGCTGELYRWAVPVSCTGSPAEQRPRRRWCRT